MHALLKSATSGPFNPEEALAGAAALDILKEELIECHTAICRRMARAYGEALGHPDAAKNSRFAGHIVALMTYQGGELPEDVRAAILDFSTLLHFPTRLRCDEVAKIGKLLNLHAQFSRSLPEGYTAQGWFNLQTDAAMNFLVAIESLKKDAPSNFARSALDDSLRQVVKILPNLWS